MKNNRHTPEQIVRKLREAEAKLGTGASYRRLPESWGSARLPSTAEVHGFLQMAGLVDEAQDPMDEIALFGFSSQEGQAVP